MLGKNLETKSEKKPSHLGIKGKIADQQFVALWMGKGEEERPRGALENKKQVKRANHCDSGCVIGNKAK